MSEESRPEPGIIRVRQDPRSEPDLRTGGGVKKMFHGVKQRLEHLAGAYVSVLDEYQAIYPSNGKPMPYLVFNLVPSSIAKAHSAGQILEHHRLHLLGARKLEERIVHGNEGDCRTFGRLLELAADLAPTEKELDEWDNEERNRKQEAKKHTKTTERKSRPEPVRRSLRSKDLSWNDVAQLSTFAGVGVIPPQDKILIPLQGEVKSSPILVTTFPFVSSQRESEGDDLGDWVENLENVVKASDLGNIRVLRGPSLVLDNLKEILRGRKVWNLERARSYSFLGGSAVLFLIDVGAVEQMQALASLPFVQTVEQSRFSQTATGSGPIFQIASPPVPKERLPVVGLVDTGIPTSSPLDPYILQRRGSDSVRSGGNAHATEVAYFLVQDGQATPWRPRNELACGVIDVARIDGTTTNPELDAAITEGTSGRDDIGTVNLSANVRRAKGSGPLNYVSTLGALFDQKSLESRELMMITSAGNSGSVGMDPPADGVHVISVGAITRRKDGTYERSDYSCHGGGIAHNVKPTLVVPVHDGNGHDPQWTTRSPLKGTGTSIAAPIGARLHSNLVHRGFTRDEALTLMIHNAVYPGRDVHHQPSVKELEIFGFGLVPMLDECDPPDRARFTMLYDVTAIRKQIKALELPIPASLTGHDAFVRLSAYVRSPVRKEVGEEYVAAEVPTRLRLFYKNKNRSIPHIDLPPEPQDMGDRYERHRVEHGWKWAVLKRYSGKVTFGNFSKFTLRVGPVIWREWAQRDFAKGAGEEGAPVQVQCVLTFYPVSKDAPAFFDAFYSAFARQHIAMEVPAQAKLEIE